jgi:hypothetical protein
MFYSMCFHFVHTGETPPQYLVKTSDISPVPRLRSRGALPPVSYTNLRTSLSVKDVDR